jgi:lysozyme family protein
MRGGSFGSNSGLVEDARRDSAQLRQGATYTVKPGDSFFSIAKKYHLDVNELMKANSFRAPKDLRVGDVVSLPHLHVVKEVSVIVLPAIERDVGAASAEYSPTDYRAASAALDAIRRGEKQLYYRPGVPLESLPADPAVKGLQQVVQNLHLDPHIEASGKFDLKTQDVVRDVERRFGVTHTGIAGKRVVECIDLLTKEYERIQAQHPHPAEAVMDRAIAAAATPAQPPQRSAAPHLTGAEAFPVAVSATLNREKGVNSSKDDHGNRGGFITNMGITAPFYNEYRQAHGEAPIRDVNTMNDQLRGLTTMQVSLIYEQMVFDRNHLDRLPPQTAIGVHDMVVVYGPRAVKLLQRTVGVPADGRIGDATVKAVSAWRDGELVDAYAEKRKEVFRSIAANDSSQLRHLDGWVKRADEVAAVSRSSQTDKLIRFYSQHGTENWDLLDPVRHTGLVLGRGNASSNYIVMRRLQEQLNDAGIAGAVKVDGVWGKQMDAVVADLRRKWQLPASGTWDASCQERLDRECRARAPMTLASRN